MTSHAERRVRARAPVHAPHERSHVVRHPRNVFLDWTASTTLVIGRKRAKAQFRCQRAAAAWALAPAATSSSSPNSANS